MNDEFKIESEDNDLYYCGGLAYQKDMSQQIEYGKEYYENYLDYDHSPIADELNHLRVKITEKYCKNPLLDIGIGSGRFITSSSLKVYGYDINPYSIAWLQEREIFIDPYKSVPNVDGWTFWDSLEHFRSPTEILQLISPGNYLFISIPIFEDIKGVKESKHFKPGEHYYYFTSTGLIKFLKSLNFKYIEHNDLETKLGRQDITTFVFRKEHGSFKGNNIKRSSWGR